MVAVALAALTKTLIVKCCTIEDWCDKFVTVFLPRLCSLQDLTFLVHYHGYSPRFREFKNIRKTPQNRRVLRPLHPQIDHIYLSCNEISRYMCFPNMDTLVATYTKRLSY